MFGVGVDLFSSQCHLFLTLEPNARHQRNTQRNADEGAKGYPIDPRMCLTKRLFIESRSLECFFLHVGKMSYLFGGLEIGVEKKRGSFRDDEFGVLAVLFLARLKKCY